MKIVHAADLHLDSPLRGLSQYEGAPVSEVRGATRRALSSLVDSCAQAEVALLLIAGDLYDGDFRDYSTALCFTEQMSRLKKCGTRVVWLRGNHDAANKITRHLRSAEHVTELSFESPQTVVFEDLGVAVHGQGYATRDVRDNLVLSYPDALAGLFNVGLLHTALDGRAQHAPYAPCSVGELEAKGYDYWALGHVHKREVVSEEPFIIFPGNLQGRHIKETGAKGATLIDVSGGKVVGVSPLTLDAVRWELAEVDATSSHHLGDVLDRAVEEMARLRDGSGDRVLATRVRVLGTSRAHGELFRKKEQIENELRAYAVDQGDIYLEQVQLCTVGMLSADALAVRRDALGDLFRDMDAVFSDEEAKRAFWESLLSPLSSVSVELLSDERIDPDEILSEARNLLEGHLLDPAREDER